MQIIILQRAQHNLVKNSYQQMLNQREQESINGRIGSLLIWMENGKSCQQLHINSLLFLEESNTYLQAILIDKYLQIQSFQGKRLIS